MYKSAVVVILVIVIGILVVVSCGKETKCTCTETSYGYDEIGVRYKISSKEVNCPDSIKENETIYKYDNYGRLISETTKECREESKGIF